MSSITSISKPVPQNGERHTLLSESELRLEVPQDTTVVISLLAGSAEIFGSELTLLTTSNAAATGGASTSSISSNDLGTGSFPNLNLNNRPNAYKLSKQSHVITGHAKFAIFTWHGCTIDIDVEFGKTLDISYMSEETNCNIVYVNTHAQLEAMRDEALGYYLQQTESSNSSTVNNKVVEPPRVLVVGPHDSGKSSVVKVLTAYATKLGRNPLLVDLDVSQNMLSIPGTITASPMTIDNISPQSYASSSSLLPNTTPLVLWYGSTDLSTNPDLYKLFLDKMGQCIDARLNNGVGNASAVNNNANPQENQQWMDAKSSGVIVNGCGWIEDMGYELMKHTIKALHINVVLVMGHDRLYSMLSTHYNKIKEQQQKGDVTVNENTAAPKVIKLPRSGGIVSRDSAFRRTSRMLSMKQYFYGQSIVPATSYANTLSSTMANVSSSTNGLSVATSSLVNQFSPSLVELKFSDVTIYKMENVSLSASMLPVSAKQSSDAVQLSHITDIGIALKHSMLAVCHPLSVEKYEKSGEARDLYLMGVTGFVVVETVDVHKEIISLLSPCSGSLPSFTLLAAEITWRE